MAKLCQTEYSIRKQAQIGGALLKLLSSGHYPDISVKDICTEAGIPRRTFYHYFESREDVLNSIIQDLMQKCFLEVMAELRSGVVNMKESFVRIFRFWEGDNRTKLDALIRNGLESRLMTYSHQLVRAERLDFLFKSHLNPRLVEIGLMVGVTDFFSLLFYWSRGGYRESPEQMAEYAIWVLPQAFSNVYGIRTDL